MRSATKITVLIGQVLPTNALHQNQTYKTLMKVWTCIYCGQPCYVCFCFTAKKTKKTLEGYLSDSYKYDLSSFAAAS